MRAGILLIAACSSTTASEPLADREADNVAMSIASTLRPAAGGGELAAMLDVAGLVRGEVPAGFRDHDGTVRGQHGGFAVHYRLACRDAHNRAIACGERSDNADVDVTWSGVLASRAQVMVASREGAWIVNDVTPERLRIDGDSHFEYASATSDDERHAFAYDASYRNIVVVRDEHWPRGGLVRYDLVVSRGQSEVVTVAAETRFFASGRATIVLPDHVYELDLTTSSLVRAR